MVDEVDPDRVAELEQQVTELAARIDDREPSSDRSPSATRRQVLGSIAAGGVLGGLAGAGSAAGATGGENTSAMVGALAGPPYKVADPGLYSGPDSSKSSISHSVGQVHFAQDTGVRYYDNGSSWDVLPFEAKDSNAVRVAHAFGSDLSAVQAAVDDLPSSGGYVWLSRENGPYPADSAELNLPDNVTIMSDGATISAGSKDVTGTATTVIQNDDFTNGNDGIQLHNLRVEGKIRIRADPGNTCEGYVARNVESFGVSDFGHHYSRLQNFEIANCETDNDGIGSSNNGNDGIHLVDCREGRVSNFFATSGDDIFALESNSGICQDIAVTGLSGTSTIGDLIKLYTNPNTGSGDDLRNISITGAFSRDLGDQTGTGSSAALEFENDGSGEIYDVVVNDLIVSNCDRGIIVDGARTTPTNTVHDITFNSPVIDSVQQGFAELGTRWILNNPRFSNGGLEGSAYDGVTMSGADSKILGGTLGPTTRHVVSISANECTVADVTVDATGSSNQGIRVNGEGARVRGNTIDATNDFAIGSSGTDDRSIITDNRTPSNNIGGDQFSGGAMLANNIAIVTRDLSLLSGLRDGQIYKHDGANTINADGGTTSAIGYYVWSETDTEFKQVVAY